MNWESQSKKGQEDRKGVKTGKCPGASMDLRRLGRIPRSRQVSEMVGEWVAGSGGYKKQHGYQ